MTLRAPAFLGIWHDIDPAYEAEWNRWHTFEHMPERAAVPGFLVGRRYMHEDDSPQRCFTLYEAKSLATFTSAPYLARLNAPTEWTQKMMPGFRNLVRGACEVVASAERTLGYAGAAQTIRLAPFRGQPDFGALVGEVAGLDDIAGAHVGVCEPAATAADTNEGTLRTGTGEEKFNAVMFVEAIDRPKLEANRARVHELLADAGCGIEASQGYQLAYVLGNSMA